MIFSYVTAKLTHFKIIIILLVLLTTHQACPKPAEAATDLKPEPVVYYVRLDIKYADGTLKESKLLMVPAGAEFRAPHFQLHKADGTTDLRETGEAKSQALHNAIENLLLKYGLKSVSSKETLINYYSSAEIVMSYEGAVKTPLSILKEGYLPGKEEYRVEILTLFSPIAFPDQWDNLNRKKRWADFFSDIKNFF